MKNGEKTYHALVKAAVVLIGICGLLLCAALVPYCLSVMEETEEVAGKTVYAVQLGLHWAMAAPCYAILVHFWLVSNLIKRGKLFSMKAVTYFKRCAILLFADVAFLLLAETAFSLAGYPMFAGGWLYAILILCGCAIAVFMFIMSKFLYQAALLQEESDGTI